MRMRGFLTGWMLALLAAPAVVLGAGSATLQGEGQTLQVTWADEQTVRMGAQGQPAYMLLREGNLYSVSTGGQRTMVMDLAALGGMMGAMRGRTGAGQAPLGTGPKQAAEVEAIEATGASEVVAGIEGEVYEVRWRDRNGQRHTDEVVLSGDPRVVELVSVMRRMARAYGEAMDQDRSDRVGQALSERGLGVLRYGDRLRLTEISGTSPGAATFELPAEPMGPSDLGM